MENGRVREIIVPVRVARILEAEDIALPREENDAFDAIHALEGRVCLTLLTEMLSRRDYAVEEARQKLHDYGFRDQEIDVTIERALEMRFLDDARFTRYFIDERKRRGWGRRKIEMELKRRGVDLEAIDGYPDAFFDDEDDFARAQALLSRKRIPDARAFEKLVRHLMSKGFSYAVSAEAVRTHLASLEEPDGIV